MYSTYRMSNSFKYCSIRQFNNAFIHDYAYYKLKIYYKLKRLLSLLVITQSEQTGKFGHIVEKGLKMRTQHYLSHTLQKRGSFSRNIFMLLQLNQEKLLKVKKNMFLEVHFKVTQIPHCY